MIEDGSFTLSNEVWRISGVNSSYSMCQSYPFALIVPKGITYVNEFSSIFFITINYLMFICDTSNPVIIIASDGEVLRASAFRARGRLPVISWCHPGMY